MHPIHTHPLQMHPQQQQPLQQQQQQLELHPLEAQEPSSTVLEPLDSHTQLESTQQLQVMGPLVEHQQQQLSLHQLQPIQPATSQTCSSLEQVTNHLASVEHEQVIAIQQQQQQQQDPQQHQANTLHSHQQQQHNQANITNNNNSSSRPLHQRPQIEGIVAEGGGPIVQWLLDNYEIADGESLPRSTVYNHYLAHCKQLQMASVNAASFGKLIRSVFIGLKTRRLGTRGHSKYHYFGVRAKQHIQQELLQHQESASGGGSTNTIGNNNDENSNQNTDFGSESDSTGGASNLIECKRIKRTEHHHHHVTTATQHPHHHQQQSVQSNHHQQHHHHNHNQQQQLYAIQRGDEDQLATNEVAHNKQHQSQFISNNGAVYYSGTRSNGYNTKKTLNNQGHNNSNYIESQHLYHQPTGCELEELRNYLGANWSTLVEEHWPQRDSTITLATTSSEMIESLDLFECSYKSYYKRMIELLSELKFFQVEQLCYEFWNPPINSPLTDQDSTNLTTQQHMSHQQPETIHHHHQEPLLHFQNDHHQQQTHEHQHHHHHHHPNQLEQQQHHHHQHHDHHQHQLQSGNVNEQDHWTTHVVQHQQNGQTTGISDIEQRQQQEPVPGNNQQQHTPDYHAFDAHQQTHHQPHKQTAPLSFYYLYQLTSQPTIVNRISQIDYTLYEAIELFLFPDVLSPIPSLLAQKIASFSVNFGSWIKVAVKNYEPHFVREKSKSALSFGYAMRRYSDLNRLATASRKVWDKRDLLSQMSIDLSRIDLSEIEHRVSLMSPSHRPNSYHEIMKAASINKPTSGNLLSISTVSSSGNNNGNTDDKELQNTKGSRMESNRELENNENVKFNEHENQSGYHIISNNNTNENDSTTTTTITSNNNIITNYHLHHSYGTIQPAQLIQNFLHLLEDPCPANSWPDWCKNLLESRVCGQTLEDAKDFYLKWHFYISEIMKELTLKSAPTSASFQLIRLLFDEYILYLMHRQPK